MEVLPRVVHAKYRGGHTIRLTFNDRSEKTIDFRPLLKGPVFRQLKNEEYFKRFFLDGGTVAWPNGADMHPRRYMGRTRWNCQKSRDGAGAPKRADAADVPSFCSPGPRAS